jgi:riboflavin kinase
MTQKSVSAAGALLRNRLGLVILLASKGALAGGVKSSTSALAGGLGVSQQTVSRWLSELSAEGLVERGFNFVRLSEKSRPLLESVSSALSAPLSAPSKIILRGRLSRGLEEGGYYLRQPGYSKQFSDILGYRPFPGTLNLVLSDADSVNAKGALVRSEGMRVAGFRREGRNFGGARLFPCELRAGGRKAGCAIVVPDKTHHGGNIVELVARENLRKSLRLREGQALEVIVPKA